MNALAAICLRLREAGLVAVVDRVAEQHDTTSGVLLTVTGKVSPAQATLFHALAAEGLDATTIARLLGWGEAAVERVVGMPEPKPSPVPPSGPRPEPEPSCDLRTLIALAVAEAQAPLLAAIADLRETVLARRRPRNRHRPLTPEAKAAEVNAWVDAHGELGVAVRRVALAHGVPIERLLSPERTKLVIAARRAAVTELTRIGLSQSDIGRILRRDHSSVGVLQRQAGAAAAYPSNAGRKATA